MRTFYIPLFCLFLGGTLSAQTVVLTGLLDSPLPGAAGRTIELYVAGTVDLAEYELKRAANGNAFRSSIPLRGTYTDEFVYVTNDVAAFGEIFGDGGDFANVSPSGTVSGTGNDAFGLFRTADGALIDQTGGEELSGDNVYQDSYLYRNGGTGPDGGWVAANWAAPGNDVLDGKTAAELRDLVPFGTYTPGGGAATVAVTPGDDLAEPTTPGSFTLTLSEAATADVVVEYDLGGSATLDADYADPNRGSTTIAAGTAFSTLTLTVIDDRESETLETVELTITSVSDASYAIDAAPATVSIVDDEAAAATLISQVQGDGPASPLVGQLVEIEGIVVGDFQGEESVGLGGFFVQEEQSDWDQDPATSEGVFVFEGDTPPGEVAVGDLVRVTGVVVEFFALTQLKLDVDPRAAVVVLAGGQDLPPASPLTLPVSELAALEELEGMRVSQAQDLVISSVFDLDRFGQITVSAGERIENFTECNEPSVAGFAAYQQELKLRTLIVNDGRSVRNPAPIELPTGETYDEDLGFRAGRSFSSLEGVLSYAFGDYVLEPTADAVLSDEGLRPTEVPAVGGDIKVASMNVLNYFNGDGRGAGFEGSRGATNQAEFERQQTKIVAAIIELDADAIGLIEIENDGYGPESALQTLVEAIEAAGGPTYSLVESPNSGSDAIQVAIVYRADRLTAVGTPAALSEPAQVFSRSRVPLAQSFEFAGGSSGESPEVFTLVVNHFKSKGGGSGATGDDVDADDGAAAFNGTRTRTAEALLDWIATDPTGVDNPNYLIVGDLNSYRREDPIRVLTDAGYVNTVLACSGDGRLACGGSPSYTFGGGWGSLDYALASPSLIDAVSGAADWPVNAPEPRFISYEDTAFYAPDFYRFSDHDPVLVGLNFSGAPPAELSGFEAVPTALGDVVLSWNTSSEVGTDRFEVQRSTNRNFETLAEVTAIGGTSFAAAYAYTDDSPISGTSYYRLRIVAADGSVEFSPSVSVDLSVRTTVDPAGGASLIRTAPRTFRLEGAPAPADYRVFDSSGRSYALPAGSDTPGGAFSLDASALPVGVYVLRTQSSEGAVASFKFVVR